MGYTSTLAQGNLMIFPKRLVFEGTQRSKELTLINNGQNPASYTISMVNYRMTENGKFEAVTEPDSGQHFADSNIRFFPRQVTLKPNEAQKVKVQLYRANQLEEGEYRSHLFFQLKEDQDPLEKKIDDEKPAGITTNLKINFGISIAVFIEVGNDPVASSLSDISFTREEKESPRLSFMIRRNGNRSVYGDFKVVHTDPSGKISEVGSVKGVAVYSPNSQRHFSMMLRPIEELDYSKGKLTIEYRAKDSKDTIMASGELMLN